MRPFMSIYIPAAADDAGNSDTLAEKLIDDMERWLKTIRINLPSRHVALTFMPKPVRG